MQFHLRNFGGTVCVRPQAIRPLHEKKQENEILLAKTVSKIVSIWCFHALSFCIVLHILCDAAVDYQ